MKSLLRFAAIVATTTSLFAANRAERPNIVLIMADDQGYGDLGATGNPVTNTPNIDRLAREGATMKTFYVSPVCSPTRASLMTGRYHQRTRVLDTFKGRSMMDPSETTIAEALRDAGYATGIFGKWHLGDNYPLRPSEQGFEQSVILHGGGLAQPSDPIENNRRYTDPILFRNNAQFQAKGFCTDVFFSAAIDFIGQAADARRPFFAYITPNAPHGPFHDVPTALYEKYKAKDLSAVLLGAEKDADTVARIFAMVENIDVNVGRLLAQLDQRNLSRNTIVIFMTDNGPNTRRYVGNMRGMKSEVHDGGVRTSFFIRWPARLRAGAASDEVAAHIDVMPTLLEAAGVAVPKQLKLDGRSFLPLLEGKSTEWPDRYLVLQTHRGDVPVPFHNAMVRNARWKLVHPSGFGRETMPPNVPFELYDVVNDPEERHDQAQQHPEVVTELKRAYEAWFASVSATRPDNFAPPRIVVGTPHETRTVLSGQDKRTVENGWMLRFEGAGTYDVVLQWKEPVGALVNEVRIGTDDRKVELTPGATTARIEGWKISAGDAVLSVTVGSRQRQSEPYNVILIHRPNS